jgi:hypothetical protein
MSAEIIQLRDMKSGGESDFSAIDQSTGSSLIRKGATRIVVSGVDRPDHPQTSFRSAPIKPTDVGRLYGTDEPDVAGQTVEFILTCQRLAQYLGEASRSLEEGDEFSADQKYMEFKDGLPSLIRFRNMSEGVGLIILQLLKIAGTGQLAHEIARGISAALRSINAIKAKPNMTFEAATELVDQLDETFGEIQLPGFEQISDLLLA